MTTLLQEFIQNVREEKMSGPFLAPSKWGRDASTPTSDLAEPLPFLPAPADGECYPSVCPKYFSCIPTEFKKNTIVSAAARFLELDEVSQNEAARL